MAKAKQPKAQDVETGENLHIEEVQQNLPALPVMTAEQKASEEIKRFDVAGAWVTKKKKEFSSLKIAGVDDKSGYKKVEEAWREIRNKRIGVKKKHEEIKADYLTITRAIDGEKNRLIKLLEEIENPLKAELDRIEEEKEAIKQKAANEEKAKLDARVQDLISSGIAFNGSYYAIGESISIDIVTLGSMTDEEFSRLNEKVTAEKAAIDRAKEEEEQRKKAEQEAMEKQRQEQEAAQKKLDEEREELARQKKEMEDQKAAIAEALKKSRAESLEALGMTFKTSVDAYGFVNDSGSVFLKSYHLSEPATEWGISLELVKEEIEKYKKAQEVADKAAEDEAEKKRKEEEENQKAAKALADRQKERVAFITGKYGVVPQGENFVRKAKHQGVSNLHINISSIKDYDNNRWSDFLKSADDQLTLIIAHEKQIEDELKKDQEQERLNRLGDEGKVTEWIQQLKNVFEHRPGLDSAHINDSVTEFCKSVDKHILWLQVQIKKQIEEATPA